MLRIDPGSIHSPVTTFALELCSNFPAVTAATCIDIHIRASSIGAFARIYATALYTNFL